MSTLEAELSYLERELRALKASFEQQASQIPVFTEKSEIETTSNLCHYQYRLPETGQQADYEVYEQERVSVIFNTAAGIDTIATIEASSDNDILPVIRRVNYSGGAKWIITNAARLDSIGNWRPTHYKIAVHAMAEGKISMENMSS